MLTVQMVIVVSWNLLYQVFYVIIIINCVFDLVRCAEDLQSNSICNYLVSESMHHPANYHNSISPKLNRVGKLFRLNDFPIIIIESVDSISRDGPDIPYM